MIQSFLRRSMPHYFAEAMAPAHDEVLHLLEARRGRGKSYILTYYVWTAIRLRVPVWANFSVDPYRLAVQAKLAGFFPTVGDAMSWVGANVHFLGDWDDLLVTYNGFVLLDEAGRIFDNRHRGQIPQVVTEWAQLSRRSRVTIVLASQSFDWLDVRFRQLADTLWMVRKVQKRGRGGAKSLPQKFVAYGLDPWSKGLAESVVRDEADRKMEVPFLLPLAQAYDTLEPISVLAGEPRWATYREVFDYLVAEGRIPESVASRVRARLTAGAQRPAASTGAVAHAGFELVGVP